MGGQPAAFGQEVHQHPRLHAIEALSLALHDQHQIAPASHVLNAVASFVLSIGSL